MKVYALPVLVLCLAGCNKGSIDTKEAVRQGVIDYLASSPEPQRQLDERRREFAVTFKENEADAMVTVQTKGGEGQPMTFLTLSNVKATGGW